MNRTKPSASTNGISALCSAALCLWLCSSCASAQAIAFSWLGASGEKLAFSSSSSRKEAQEGRFGPAAERPSRVRYILAQSALLPAGSDLAVDVELIEGQPRIDLALSEDRDGDPESSSASFPLLGRKARFYLKTAPGSPIASLSVGSSGQGSFRIAGVSMRPAFSGIENDGDTISVSSGFRMTLGPDRGMSLPRPFAGIGLGTGTWGSLSSGLVLSYGPAAKDSDGVDEISIDVSAGGRRQRLSLRMGPAGGTTVIGSELLSGGIDLIEAASPADREIRAFCARTMDGRDYELADLGRVLASGMPAGGADYELYRWDILPSVLILVFKDYAAQDRYLKRLAFFVEKKGYRGTLQPDSVIGNLHGWNAHDYRTEDLAAFFRKASADYFPLSEEERALERLLSERGLISGSGARIEAGAGALISISLESAGALRRKLLVHESTHGIFFVDEEYRKFARDAWARVGGDEKWFWTSYFGWAAYDTGDDYLMANEFQAYLMQQPISEVEEYFTRSKADELVASRPYLAEKVEAYMEKHGRSFAARAGALDEWLGAKYGLSAGRTYRLEVAR